MKIGLCAWSFTGAHREAGRTLDPFSPDGLAHLASERGLRAIEGSPGPLDDKSPEELAAFKDLLDRHRLDIVLDTGGRDYPDDIAHLCAALHTAHRVGARIVRTTISGQLEGDRSAYGFDGWKAHLAGLVAPFKEAAALAAQYDIAIGIENHQDICSWELCWLCQQVGSPHLGVTMDCGNALAVGETPLAFAWRVMPHLKHVHIKDYTVHPTPSGYRLKRCAIGAGVVDWPALLAAFAQGAPQVLGCIELGASSARHIRLLEGDWWSTYPDRPLIEGIDAIRTLHQAAQPPEEDWRTPHERGESPQARVEYEMAQLEASVAYLKDIA